MMRKPILVVALGVGMIGSSAVLMAQKNNAAEVLLGQGLHQEEVDNNCREAIKTYQKVTAQRNVPPNIAARAQLHIGGCQEQLGQREARAAYELLIERYPEQADLVAEARARMASLPSATPAAPQSTVMNRRFVPLPAMQNPTLLGGSVSADGHFMAGIELVERGAEVVVVRNLRTGEVRRVSPVANATGNRLANAVLSPDGQRLVYTSGVNSNESELRVVDLQERGVPRFKVLARDRYVQAFAWTPDGKAIVVFMRHGDGKPEDIGLVSAADGSRRVLTVVDGLRGGWLDTTPMFVSPDGRYLAHNRRAGASERFDVFILPLTGGPELQAVQHPADDRVVGWSPDGRHLLFTSDRNSSTPGLYALAMTNGRPQGTRPELIQTGIGQIDSFGVTKAGALYYFERPANRPNAISEIEIATFDFDTGVLGEPALVGTEKRLNYAAPAWSRDGKYLAYRLQDMGRRQDIHS